MNKLTFTLILIILAFASCRTGSKKSAEEDISSIKQFKIVEVWRTGSDLMTPESVIYDKQRDVFYVSNLNQEPRKKDENGFISRMDKDGNILDLRWIEGLSSPKGMAIVGDILYAADVDEIVAMDINKGEIVRKIFIEGAKMINDISADDNGNLYISDTDAAKIYLFSDNAITDWLAEGLNGPNGLLFDGDRLLVASQGSQDFASVDIETKNRLVLTEGVNRGDGIAFTGIPGYYLLSDWAGEIFIINPDNSKSSLINTKEQSNTADIEYLPGENLLLVPTFNGNCVVAYRLEELTEE
jgi:sugar lactone lactonase YvrE